MPILSISFKNFRNLKEPNSPVAFSPSINVITGANAAGKTSVLEALYMLTTARSFRTRLTHSIVRHDEQDKLFLVTGRVDSSASVFIGIQKSDEKTRIRIQGEDVKASSELALLQPILLFEPATFSLLTGSPGDRRRFLDWGVFHVEHRFIGVWNEYQRCLKQRNSLLRSDKINAPLLDVWERKLSEISEEVSLYRHQYFNSLERSFAQYMERFGLCQNVKLSYHKGWSKEEALVDVLKSSRERDRLARFTNTGPHRADFKMLLEGRPVREVFSRGQLKLTTLALFMAHIDQLSLRDKQTVLLIDDISSELDQENLGRAIAELRRFDSQVFLTALDRDIISLLKNSSAEGLVLEGMKMFHVEHGEIKEITTLATEC